MTAPKTKPVSLEIIPSVATGGGIVLSIDLALAINAAFTTAQTLAGSAREKAQHAIVAAIDCGRLLERQKGSLPHGAWSDWLAVNCPEISARTAQRYIRLSKTTHVSFFNDAQSLRQAYLTTGVLPEPAPREAVQPDANTPVIKFTKGLDQFRRWYHRRTDDTPLAKWTPEARRLLRQELTWFKKLHDDLAA